MPRATKRCPWCESHPLYVAYHDDEWGVPEHDDRALYEKLILDGFQAGLSWWIILKKREDFRRAFAGFDPAKVARFDARKLAALGRDPTIVRNRAKIEGARTNARAYLALRESGQSFADYLWSFVDGETIHHRFRDVGELLATSPESEALAKDLKRRGFKFCGPTIIYAFMQAVGMVNDHLTGCFRYRQLRGRQGAGSGR